MNRSSLTLPPDLEAPPPSPRPKSPTILNRVPLPPSPNTSSHVRVQRPELEQPDTTFRRSSSSVSYDFSSGYESTSQSSNDDPSIEQSTRSRAVRFTNLASLHLDIAAALTATASHLTHAHVSPSSQPSAASDTSFSRSQSSASVGSVEPNGRLNVSDDDISPTSTVPRPSHLDHRTYNSIHMSSRTKSTSTVGIDGRETTSWWPRIRATYDPARKLNPDEIFHQRCLFFAIVFTVNAACLVGALTARNHAWVFAFIIFVKSKDCIQSIYSAIALAARALYRLIFPLKPVTAKWILTLIPAYSESEEQIVKTIFSLRDNSVEPHKQVMCVILDGRHRDIREHMTTTLRSFRCNYTTSKAKAGELSIDVGFMEDVPVIVIEKIQNAGKKDSLILCHDLFNWPRDNMPHYSQLLRAQIWEEILPVLTGVEDFPRFDMIFCTDADST